MSDPWAFGWTQVLTIVGFIITALIAIGGFRSFERWRREKIEEKRIDTAIDALVLMREMKFVFENIRSPASFPNEWEDMPERAGEDDDKRRTRGSFYAVLKRIDAHRDFFERAWRLQIRCGALFGDRADNALLLLQKARRQVEVSAGMLLRDPVPQVHTEDNKNTWERFRSDVWNRYSETLDKPDPVLGRLQECERSVEAICRPILDRQFGRKKRGGFGVILDWLGL